VPVTPTYPGVYIEELPSTTHTIVAVATSITAFVGYTKRGPVNQATEVFGFGDFERTFGTLDPDSPLTYAVQQFFLNGGSDAFVVRVASGAKAATFDLRNRATPAAPTVLSLAASSAGLWGNTLRVTIDQDTINPNSLFNLSVTEYVMGGGSLVPGRSESFRNLTMNSTAPTYAVDTMNNNSQLLSATRPGPPVFPPVYPNALTGPPAPQPGSSVSGPLTAPIVITPTANTIVVSVSGAPPTPLTIAGGGTLNAVATQIQNAATAAGLSLACAAAGGKLTLRDSSAPITERSSVRVIPAPANDATTLLQLGLAAGGIEVDAIAAYHPMPTGTAGNDIDASLGAPGLGGITGAAHTVGVSVTVGTAPAVTVSIPFLDATTTLATKEDLRARLQSALQAASLAHAAIGAELGGARVAIVNNALVVTAGGRPDTQIQLQNDGVDATAAKIGFGGGATNIASYSPAIVAPPPLGGQAASASGADGTAPGAVDIQGDPDAKTGIYALENVDLFNLLVLPDDFTGNDEIAISSTAMTYCEARRAMLLVDLPSDKTTLTAAQTWIKNPSTPKSPNAAAYFPRLQFPDPMQGYRPRVMPAAGAIAGLYARTDAARGVWKAPAGTAAQLRGPTAVQVPLTDMEAGTINPLGLNAIRALPVYGIVAFGARTTFGADVMSSEWKYVPVRRTALYIEESLFRGTKWVVFEPNDEPLWAQVRLSVGAFMHDLFRHGAFQGSSPRQAYLVKCDSDTTTQADINLGIVNILVGFAPLRPAEFVVIQITQLAGQVDT
jgi:phage tail sheath protein FI